MGLLLKNAGVTMAGGGGFMPIWPFIIGSPVREIDGVGAPDGIRTTGRTPSIPEPPMRDMIDAAGDPIPSLKVDAPNEDFRLMAILGV
jgi:hypothetical protein